MLPVELLADVLPVALDPDMPVHADDGGTNADQIRKPLGQLVNLRHVEKFVEGILHGGHPAPGTVPV
jgi:hypothetical protein